MTDEGSTILPNCGGLGEPLLPSPGYIMAILIRCAEHHPADPVTTFTPLYEPLSLR